MWQTSWCELAVTAMAVAVATSAAAAITDGSSSDENLHQALVLVNILKSGILSRSRTVLPTSGNFADYASYRPWPLPYRGLPFNRHGIPFRRMDRLSDLDDGDYTRRKDNNATRQMEYEDPFGPHPGGDGQGAPDEATTGSSNQPSDVLTTDTTPPMPKNAIETTFTETKKGLNNKNGTTSAIKDKIATVVTKKAEATMTTSVTLKTIINIKTTGTQITSKTAKTLIVTSVASKIKGEIEKVITKSKTKKTEDPKTTSKPRFSTVNSGGIVRLKHQKGSDTLKGLIGKDKKITEEHEIVQAAFELQREAAETGLVQYRCHTRPQTSVQTGSQSSCSSNAVCNEGSTILTSPRYKATPRIHLSRSSRPPVPLPANNAFCYTNPESPLCRTFI